MRNSECEEVKKIMRVNDKENKRKRNKERKEKRKRGR